MLPYVPGTRIRWRRVRWSPREERRSAFGDAVDITDEAALKGWVAHAGEQLGGIDILVSNVGAMAIGADKDSWQQNLNTRCTGPRTHG